MDAFDSPQAQDPQPQDPRDTPLRGEHEELGASFTDFGGWLMPVRYTSDLAEHHAVRQAAGLFDISHMGEILVEGSGAGAFLDHALAGAISAVAVGKAKYTMILAEDGGILDDLIVYRLQDDEFLVIANAGNRETVARALTDRVAGFDATVADESDDYALIAVQGPAAERILAATQGIAELTPELGEIRNYAWGPAVFAGEPLLIARTGYTGEDGFELLVPVSAAVSLWRAVLAAGEPEGLVPAGLAARDTLRLEAGMPLYGHELSRDIVPAQAGLGRVIPAGKTGFIGEHTPRPDARVLIGLAAEGRRAGRAGYGVYSGDELVGEITSGALSPTLGHPIAMAFVDPSAKDAPELTIDIRGTRIPASVTALPFYRRNS
ncbi:glycine cleavage system aminomethyltransferase GcvT [Microbacterium paludicola]|uniref:Aminomethyltransferase n=1 Tax=Microbacterium paludicola TaxID=300019 RepID=A0A4Y9FXD7_9MICO|nr:glycine cleavage system aminomethyltransferase GcvT [Microbacterium paludicola]MBF0815706.1 glycine cleavage system aminomethyltransferase GcvT [Microbacterium paludicola]TFU33547.1 glycine cleavage system aminomethyltransferase GcvT [Microbacterium paludicola]